MITEFNDILIVFGGKRYIDGVIEKIWQRILMYWHIRMKYYNVRAKLGQFTLEVKVRNNVLCLQLNDVLLVGIKKIGIG